MIVALDNEMEAGGDLFWDDGETIGEFLKKAYIIHNALFVLFYALCNFYYALFIMHNHEMKKDPAAVMSPLSCLF